MKQSWESAWCCTQQSQLRIKACVPARLGPRAGWRLVFAANLLSRVPCHAAPCAVAPAPLLAAPESGRLRVLFERRGLRAATMPRNSWIIPAVRGRSIQGKRECREGLHASVECADTSHGPGDWQAPGPHERPATGLSPAAQRVCSWLRLPEKAGRSWGSSAQQRCMRALQPGAGSGGASPAGPVGAGGWLAGEWGGRARHGGRGMSLTRQVLS